MTYTLSIVAANGENGGKIKFKNNGMQYRHTFRNSMNADRFKDGFKNKNIDWDRTRFNKDYINPDYLEEGQSSVEDAIKNKFDREYNGKRKVRSDAVVAREMIIQLKHDVLDFEQMNDAEKDKFTSESEKAYKAILEHLNDDFDGNIIGSSIHYDETNPHMHVMVVPMTPEGRLSQKDYFKPADYKRRVKELRAVANDSTSDDFVVNQENKLPKGVKAVRNAEFTKNADKIEAERRILKDEQDAIEAEVRYTVRNEMKEKLSKDEGLLNEVRKEMRERYKPLLEDAHERYLELIEKENEEKEKDIEEIKKKSLEELNRRWEAYHKRSKEHHEKISLRERNVELRERLLDRESIEQMKSDVKVDMAYQYADNLAAITAIKRGDNAQALEILSRPFTSDIDSEKPYIPSNKEVAFTMGNFGVKANRDSDSVFKVKSEKGMTGISYEPSTIIKYHKERQEKERQEKERQERERQLKERQEKERQLKERQEQERIHQSSDYDIEL